MATLTVPFALLFIVVYLGIGLVLATMTSIFNGVADDDVFIFPILTLLWPLVLFLLAVIGAAAAIALPAILVARYTAKYREAVRLCIRGHWEKRIEGTFIESLIGGIKAAWSGDQADVVDFYTERDDLVNEVIDQLHRLEKTHERLVDKVARRKEKDMRCALAFKFRRQTEAPTFTLLANRRAFCVRSKGALNTSAYMKVRKQLFSFGGTVGSLILLVITVLAVGCSQPESAGTLGEPCKSDGTCQYNTLECQRSTGTFSDEYTCVSKEAYAGQLRDATFKINAVKSLELIKAK